MCKIHPSAEVQTTDIGEGTMIWQFAVVLSNAKIGKNCNINAHTFIENNVILGDNVTIKSGVYLWDGIVLENDVFIGPNVTFINNRYPRSKQYPIEHIGCVIKEGASIGANATILSNITIGKYAMIGAGSVLTKNVSDFTLWRGNPAKRVRFVTKTGITLGNDLIDRKTGDKYILNGQEPQKT
jgi:acetyltransferase-like isoleucine patch superfamily enzyme